MKILNFLIFLCFATGLALFLFAPAETLGQLWYNTHRSSLNGLQVLLERYLYPPLWGQGVVPLLKQPPWFLPLLLAGFLSTVYFLLRLLRPSR